MPKSRALVPFSNPKPLVPGAPGGRSGYWKQQRKIEALKCDMAELGKVLARLSQELIEQVIWFNSPPETRVSQQRRISQIMGALKREKSLLNGLIAAGFDLHPLISELFIKKVQEQFEKEDQHERDHQSVRRSLDHK